MHFQSLVWQTPLNRQLPRTYIFASIFSIAKLFNRTLFHIIIVVTLSTGLSLALDLQHSTVHWYYRLYFTATIIVHVLDYSTIADIVFIIYIHMSGIIAPL